MRADARCIQNQRADRSDEEQSHGDRIYDYNCAGMGEFRPSQLLIVAAALALCALNCAAATATGDVLSGMRYMIAFGLGTVPMLLAISLLGTKLQFALRFKVQRLIPASLILVGMLLLLRGMELGIPYVSPKLPAQPDAASSCH